MTVDREQIRRDAQEIIDDAKGTGVFMPNTAAVFMAQEVISLLAELEQAERALERQVPILVDQRDLADRHRDEAFDRLAELEARLEQADQTNATLTRRLTDQRHRAENAEVRASKGGAT